MEEHTHHPVEERILVKKTYNSAGSLKETVYYINENFVQVVNSSGTFNFTYVYHEGQLVAELKPDNSKIFIHGDHLGSTSAVTDEEGIVLENTLYSPFGEIVSGGSESRFDYEAKEYDSLVGDYDFHFRKYCVEYGIFCQPDTLIQNVYDPQSLNRYMFERGNPYKNTDPGGHWVQVVAYASLIVWQFGDVAGYAGLTLGYTYMAIRFSGEGYGEKAWSSLQSAGMSVIPETLVALPKGWVSLPGDVKKFSEDWKEAHSKKKKKEKETITTPDQIDKDQGYQRSNVIMNQANQATGGGYRTSEGGYEKKYRSSGGESRKQGVGRDYVSYDIPSSATYYSGFWKKKK